MKRMRPVDNLCDSWEHSIVLEKQLRVDPIESYPVCTGGLHACSPGPSIQHRRNEAQYHSPGGPNRMREVGKPEQRTQQHNELRDWFAYDFDPMAFSTNSANQMPLPLVVAAKPPGNKLSTLDHAGLPKTDV